MIKTLNIPFAYKELDSPDELNPDDREVLNAIGYIYLIHFDETAKAIDFFEKATRADPNYSDAYNNMGFAYEKLGQYEKAIHFYKKALSNLTYATPEQAYRNMGNSYYRLGKYEDALHAYKEAIKRAPELSLTYMRMALCYNAMGRYGEASTAMAQAKKLDPVYKGDKEKAADDFSIRQLKATGHEENDLRDYIEILKY